jgi:hypothetical protein
MADMVPKSAAYIDYLMLDFAHAGKPRDAAYWQRVRKQLIHMLEDHQHFVRRNINLESGPAERPPLLDDLTTVLLDAVTRAADGESHPLFVPMKLPGGRGNRRRENKSRCIAYAVGYETAVDAGWITDRRSRQNIAEAFRVSRRQVQRWIRAAGPLTRRLADMKVRWPRLPRHDDAQYRATQARILRKMMPALGADYAGVRRRKIPVGG